MVAIQCGEPVGISELSRLSVRLVEEEDSNRYMSFIRGVKNSLAESAHWNSDSDSLFEKVKVKVIEKKFSDENPEEGLPQTAGLFLIAYDYSDNFETKVLEFLKKLLGEALSLVGEKDAAEPWIKSTNERIELTNKIIEQAIINTMKHSLGGTRDREIVSATVYGIMIFSSSEEEFVQSVVKNASHTMLELGAGSEIFMGVIEGFAKQAKAFDKVDTIRLIGEVTASSSLDFDSEAVPIISKLTTAAVLSGFHSIEALNAVTEGMLSADLGDAYEGVLESSFKKMKELNPSVSSSDRLSELFHSACEAIKSQNKSEECSELDDVFIRVAEASDPSLTESAINKLVSVLITKEGAVPTSIGVESEIAAEPEDTSSISSDDSADGSDDSSDGSDDSSDGSDDSSDGSDDSSDGSDDSSDGSDDSSDGSDDSSDGSDEVASIDLGSDLDDAVKEETKPEIEPIVEEVTPVCLSNTYGNGVDGDINIAPGEIKTLGVDILSSSRSVSSHQSYIPDWVGFVGSDANNKMSIVGDGAGLAIGDEVLIYIAKGAYSGKTAEDLIAYQSRVGTYAIKCVLEITVGEASTELLFDSDLGLEKDETDVVSVQRLPQFNSLSIEDTATLTVQPWDGSKGGLMAFKVKGIFELKSAGTIDLTELGYRGGDSLGLFPENFQGAIMDKNPQPDVSVVNNRYGKNGVPGLGGGGGGGTRYYKNSSSSCSGGKGFVKGQAGGCRNSGSTGPSSCCGHGGGGGAAAYLAPNYLNPDLTKHILLGTGAAAGAGGGTKEIGAIPFRNAGTHGEDGGGALLFFANKARIFGSLTSPGGVGGNGQQGAHGYSIASYKNSGGGGGGSGGYGGQGGTFYGYAESLMMFDPKIDLAGGAGGSGGKGGRSAGGGPVHSGAGGAGASGEMLIGKNGSGLINYSSAIGPLPDLSSKDVVLEPVDHSLD